MEIIIGLVVCVLLWKIVDSLSSRKEHSEEVTRRTTITQNQRGERTVKIDVTETLRGSDSRGSIKFPDKNNDLTDYEIAQMPPPVRTIQPIATSQLPDNTSYNPSMHNSAPSRLPQAHVSKKKCGKCGKNLLPDMFFNSSKQADGLSAWCKDCHAILKAQKADKSRYKVCPKCKQNREKTSYYRSTKNDDGLTKWCKFCLKKHS